MLGLFLLAAIPAQLTWCLTRPLPAASDWRPPARAFLIRRAASWHTSQGVRALRAVAAALALEELLGDPR